MRNIFIFWIGEQKAIKNQIDYLKNMGFNVIVGPSTKDDIYLSNNFEYYKRSKQQKKYSFCSDVWRHYILSKKNGMYIDTTVELGSNFAELYDYAMAYDVWIPRVGYKAIASAVMASNGGQEYFKKILALFKKNNDFGDTMLNWIGPHLQDYFAEINGHFKGIGASLKVIEGICYDTIFKITNEKTIYKIGFGSWFDSPSKKPKQFWENSALGWEKKDPARNVVIKSIRKNKTLPVINFYGLRDLYDKRPRKKLPLLLESYKKAKKVSRPCIGERILWSKIYRFFKRGE